MKIPLNENYFENIDTPNKAYYLGFIAGDANLRYNIDHYTLRIELNIKDLEILEKFKKDLESSHNISTRDRFDERYNKTRNSCIIEISNNKLCKDLIKNGVGTDKSKNLKLLSLIDNLMKHYIRGLIDSDGGWHIRPHKNEMQFYFCSPIEKFVYDIRNFLIEKCNLQEVKINPNKFNTCFSFSYSGNVQCKRIYHYLYDDGCPWLDRKYKLSKNFFDTVKLSDREINLEHCYSNYTYNICKCEICKLCKTLYNRFCKNGIHLKSSKITELCIKYIDLYKKDTTYRKVYFYKILRKEVDELPLRSV